MFAQPLTQSNNLPSTKYRFQKLLLVAWLLGGLLSISLFPGWLSTQQSTQPRNMTNILSLAEWSYLEGAISDAEYHLAQHAPDQNYNAPYFSAPNRNHGWNVAFTTNGIYVSPQESKDWEWGLNLVAYGYANFMQAVELPRLSSHEKTITYTWNDDLSEWWINSPSGLEQGFTIKHRPDPPVGTDSSLLIFQMELKGNLIPTLSDGVVQFRKEDGGIILTYDQIHVIDAKGNVIPAWIAHNLVNQQIIQLEIDDAQATYPLTIDPWVQSAKLTASDGAASDFFGWSVAISGNTVVAGAPFDSGGAGSAYVFTRPTSGWQNMTQTAKLTASDAEASDQFGYSVAISGDTIVVGSPYEDQLGSSAGSVYVFIRPVTGWTTSAETAKLTATDGGANDNLGISVGVSGDTVVAGAYRDVSSGSAYVFTRPTTGWTSRTEVAKLTPSDGATNDYFGWSVAVAEDTIVVGAYLDDDNFPSSGSAYVFVRPPGGWQSGNQTAKLTAGDSDTNDNFGRSVTVSEDIIVVGANLDDDPPRSDSGSAYIYVRPSGGWVNMTHTAKLNASDPANSDQFGFSVAASGTTVVVGAPYDDDRGSASGSAYVFVRPSTGWVSMTETAKQSASDGAANDYYGYSVAVSGDNVVVGASSDDDRGAESGSAYVFQNSFCTKQSGNWGDSATWVGSIVPSSTSDACISTGDAVALSTNAAANRLLVNPNASLDLSTFTITVEDNVTNHGTLEQTRNVNGSSNVAFLEIQNIAASSVKYRGMSVDPTGNNQNLGSTSVALRETQDWFSWYESAGINTTLYCTETGDGSPSYAQRCYSIAPETDPTLSVLVRLWGLSSELNGITESNLSVYRNSIGSTWVELTSNRGVGNDGVSYSYAEGETADFSAFLLGETGGGNSPTAISLQTFANQEITDKFILFLFIPLGLLFGILAFIRHRQHYST